MLVLLAACTPSATTEDLYIKAAREGAQQYRLHLYTDGTLTSPKDPDQRRFSWQEDLNNF